MLGEVKLGEEVLEGEVLEGKGIRNIKGILDENLLGEIGDLGEIGEIGYLGDLDERRDQSTNIAKKEGVRVRI